MNEDSTFTCIGFTIAPELLQLFLPSSVLIENNVTLEMKKGMMITSVSQKVQPTILISLPIYSCLSLAENNLFIHLLCYELQQFSCYCFIFTMLLSTSTTRVSLINYPFPRTFLTHPPPHQIFGFQRFLL